MTSVTRQWDGTAMVLSGACLAHCLLLPIAAAALPVLGIFAQAEWVHWLFVALAIPTSYLALRARTETSRGMLVLRALAAAGLLLLLLGALGWPSHEAETLLTVIGGLILATTHGINFWRKAHTQSAHD